MLAPPPGAAIGGYWRPHTPDVPEGLEGPIEEAVVEELEEVSMKETEYLNKTHSLTTTIATDGHSVRPPSISHCDSSSPSSNNVCADTDVAASTSDSSSSIGSRVLMPNKPSKPQRILQTCDLNKMRGEKKRQGSTAVTRRSKDKDARNRERKSAKATDRAMQKEEEVSTQITGASKGGNVPSMLRPRGGQVARTPRPRGWEKSERPSIPGTL